MILSGFRLIPAVWFLLLSFVISPFGEICAQSKSFREVYELKINSSGISGANVSERYFSSKSLQNSITKELNRWVNNGLPFAQIRFDSIRDLAVHQIIATLEPGPAIVNGELINHGDTSLSSKMVCRWIRFRKNQPFELQKFRKASLLLNQMPFVEQMEAPRLEWFGEKAIVHLNLQKRKVNSFTGILGVLPQSEGKGGTILTGNVDAGPGL